MRLTRQRSAHTNVRVRPWLQDFRDYAFDRRIFGVAEVRAQIKGAQRRRGRRLDALESPERLHGQRRFAPEEVARRQMIRLVRLASRRRLVLSRRSRRTAEPLPPNELGRVMILEYHKIDYPEERWTRTPENFRRDLETPLRARLPAGQPERPPRRTIALPAGTTPSCSRSTTPRPAVPLPRAERHARRSIPSPASASSRPSPAEHPDFGRAATFYVLPGASKPNRLFNQPEHEGRKLQYLVSRGYEIGNHTLWHANLGKYDETTVRAQIAEAQLWVQRHVPDYRIRTLALPHGVYPKDVSGRCREPPRARPTRTTPS